jgi:hypothetical protein
VVEEFIPEKECCCSARFGSRWLLGLSGNISAKKKEGKRPGGYTTLMVAPLQESFHFASNENRKGNVWCRLFLGS